MPTKMIFPPPPRTFCCVVAFALSLTGCAQLYPMVDGVKQTFSRIGNSISGTPGQDANSTTAPANDTKQADTTNRTSFLDTLISGASTAANLMQQGANIQRSVTQLGNAATLGSSALDSGSLQSGMNALRSGTRALQSGAQAVQAGSTLIAGVQQTSSQQTNNIPQGMEEPIAESVPDSPQEICQAVRENMVKAELRYLNKKISRVPAEFESANKIFLDVVGTKLFTVKPDKKRDKNIEIYANNALRSDYEQFLKEVVSLSKGERVKVTGIIIGLEKPYDEGLLCRIGLDYARFEKMD